MTGHTCDKVANSEYTYCASIGTQVLTTNHLLKRRNEICMAVTELAERPLLAQTV